MAQKMQFEDINLGKLARFYTKLKQEGPVPYHQWGCVCSSPGGCLASPWACTPYVQPAGWRWCSPEISESPAWRSLLRPDRTASAGPGQCDIQLDHLEDSRGRHMNQLQAHRMYWSLTAYWSIHVELVYKADIRREIWRKMTDTCSEEGNHSILCKETATLDTGEESQQEAFLKFGFSSVKV